MSDEDHPRREPAVAEAQEVLLSVVDRRLTGDLTDPAVLAAVVAVERLTVALRTTDTATLTRALSEGAGAVPDASRPGHDLAELLQEGYGQVLEGLNRRADGRDSDAALVNPDGGAFEIVTDASLLRAAVRAAQGSIDAMPYYRERYGARGSRFASTDSAWLVSLAPLPADVAVQQVGWLSRVLAGRGMPSWLMEVHLRALVDEVAAAAGPQAVGSLPEAERSLTQVRRTHVDDELLLAAEEWADETAGYAVPVPRAGLLLAAAVADVRSGLVRDDHALAGWVTDPAHSSVGAATALAEVRERVLAQAR
ncbi:hypothetical protein [Lapillicoccus jejuensis]|uniref:Uncharacterized protein n=1 Tax=Lapillicoccus jejuensis TaxID=402171 RepID=A0A542DYN9_9MICO|nr:hypothetical protein [Lapillicoccus jejuensis]TQJ08169.1 hypothetical protein FB458_1253 [Lapillicoccus jejuensis]